MSIYFNYPGVRHRYAYDWSGGAGGIMHNSRAADTLALGAADLYESGYDDPNWIGDYKLKELMIGVGSIIETLPQPLPPNRPMKSGKPLYTPRGAARRIATGDFPAFRLDGPEPIDPQAVSGIPFWDGLSDNEKLLFTLAAAGGAFWIWRRRKKRKARR